MSDITVNNPITAPVVVAKTSETTIVVDNAQFSTTVEVVGIVSGKDYHFVFRQDQNSDTWEIEHNLNKYPSVTVVDSGNNVVYAEVEYVDKNNLIIRFNGSTSGKAYLN